MNNCGDRGGGNGLGGEGGQGGVLFHLMFWLLVGARWHYNSACEGSRFGAKPLWWRRPYDGWWG